MQPIDKMGLKTYKEHIEKRFTEWDKRPHTDYRMIAKNLAIDYFKLNKKLQRIEKENTKQMEEQKEDKKIIWDLIAELYDYIQDTDYIEKEYIYEQLATMQNYAK